MLVGRAVLIASRDLQLKVPAGSLVLGGSHRVSGSATQVPVSSLVLEGSHWICSSGSSMQSNAGGWFSQILGPVAQILACSLVLGGSHRVLGSTV